jgi:hypothetical protein
LFLRIKKLPIEAESDFVLIYIIGIQRDAVFRSLVWEAVVTAHGEWTGRDENHRSVIPSSDDLDRGNRLTALRGLWLRHSKAAG